MTDEKPPGPSGADRQEELLRQLVNLAASVEQLAQRSSTRGQDVTPLAEPEPPTPQQRKEQFSYSFLGHLLGRRGKEFVVTPVTVKRSVDGKALIFEDLLGGRATAALLRGREGSVELLTGLVQGRDTPLTKIKQLEPIDAIVMLGENSVPLTIGCPPPPIIIE